MNTTLDQLTAANLRHAADITEEIEKLQAELEQILSGASKPGKRAGAKAKKAKRAEKKSAAVAKTTRKKRAKKKTARKNAAKKTAKKKGRRPLTAAARKAMSDARKLYWANKRKEEAKK